MDDCFGQARIVRMFGIKGMVQVALDKANSTQSGGDTTEANPTTQNFASDGATN